MRLSVWCAGIFLACSAAAQTTSTAIKLGFDTGLNLETNTFTGPGTLTPYGSASISLDLSSRAILFTLADGDTITALGATFTGGVDTGAGTANITGGTGAFVGASGSFSFQFAIATDTTFGIQGSGTLVLPPSSAGPGGSGYPVAGPGGSGYPVSGPGGSGYVCADGAEGAGGAVWRPLNPHPAEVRRADSGTPATTAPACTSVAMDGSGGAGSNVLVFNACGVLTWESDSDGTTSGSSVLTFDGSGGAGSSVLTNEGAGGLGSSVFAFDGSGSGGAIFACILDGGGSAGGSVLTMDGSGGSGGAIWRPLNPHPAAKLSSAAASTSASTILNISSPIQPSAATFTATASCPATPSACWISIPAAVATGSIAANSAVSIPVTINQPGTAAGVYQANVALTITPSAITPSGGAASTIVSPITVILPSSAASLSLSQTALQFQAVAGSTTPLTQFIAVSNAGSGTLPFSATASTLTGGNWLTASPGSGGASPGTPVNVTLQVNPSGLAAGQYSGLVNFTASGSATAPQAVEVALTVLPPASATGPLVTPAAVTFVAPATGNPASQTVQLINLSNQTLTVIATPQFQTTPGWFTATAPSNSVAAGGTLTETIAVNTTGLPAGPYAGSVDLHIPQLNADYYAGVILTVPGAAAAVPGLASATTTTCTPAQLLPVFTNLESGFQAPAGLPATVQVSIADDCGNPLNSGAAVAYFSSGDASVSLTSLGNGQWTGTWLPHNAAGTTAAVGVMATSFSPSLYGSAGVLGTVTANSTTPIVKAGGVVSAASVAAGGPLPVAPGEFISIFGSNLAAAGQVTSTTPPYLSQLGHAQVMLSGEAMPLQVLASGQINAIVPYDAAVNATQQIMVELNGSAYSMPENVVVAAAQPSVFTQDQSGSGAGAILTAQASDGSVTLNTPSAPATAGDVLEVFCTGLGTVSPAVPAGTAAPLVTLSYTTNTVTATIGGQPAPVQFAGLAPGYAGLYQVNVTVPPGVTPGSAVPVVLTELNATSPPVTAAIH